MANPENRAAVFADDGVTRPSASDACSAEVIAWDAVIFADRPTPLTADDPFIQTWTPLGPDLCRALGREPFLPGTPHRTRPIALARLESITGSKRNCH